MSDGPAPHPLGIEAVHWSAGAGSDLVVRVAGRWRRRRTPTTVPPLLAIDTEHQRYRFSALPDPPSVRGAQPGLWQVSFTVPASLAPYLSGRLTLILGSASISLPPAISDPGEPVLAAGPIVLEDRRQRAAAPAEPEAALRVAGAEAANGDAANGEAANGEAKALLDQLERELAHAGRETARLRTELERAEGKRREAEQFAHAEAAMRLELGRDHAERIRRHEADARAVLELVQAAQIHARGLAHEVETLRRSADEAGQPSRAWTAAAAAGSRPRALAAELVLARSTPPAPAPVARGAAPLTPGLALELVMLAKPPGRRRAAGARVEGALLRLAAERAQADELFAQEPEASARDRVRAAFVADAIEGIARQIDAVRAAIALLPPRAAEGSGNASAAATPWPAEPGHPAAAVAPARLAAALSRLREEYPPPPESVRASVATPPAAPQARSHAAELAAALAAARGPDAPDRPAAARPEPEPAAPAPGFALPRTRVAPWLRRALKDLLGEDPARVGSVMLALLPAQGLVVAGPVSYDLVLSDMGCRAVKVRDDEVHLDVLAEPRPLGEVDFRIEGDLAGFARLLLYGRVRRRLSRRVARVRGDRRALAALGWLVREPLDLHQLYASGVRLDPDLALLLVAHMIDPSWTAGERFAIGHESPESGGRVYLLVRDGARPRVSRQAPLGPVGTTLRCSDEQLLALLAGAEGDEIAVRGVPAPVKLVCAWIARAQRDS